MNSRSMNHLRQNVLIGLMSVSVLCGGMTALPADAEAATPVYSTQSQEQRLKDLKAEVARAQKELAAREAAHNVLATTDQSAPEDSALSFSQRIQSILDSYNAQTKARHGDYSRFLPKANEAAEETAELASAPAETTAQPAKEEATASAPSVPSPSVPSAPAEEASGLPAIPMPNQARTSIAGDHRYNFDWRGTPLAQSLYGVAKIAQKGVVVNGDIKGNVYMSLHQVTCDQALDYLSRAFGINWMADDNNIIVTTGDQMMQSKVFSVKYANKDLLAKEFQSIGIDASKIYANPETGTISVTGTPYQLTEVQQRLDALDHPVAQCLLLAQLIEIDHGKDLDLGLTYTLPTYSHTASTSGSTTDTLHGNWIEKLTFAANSTANKSLSKGKVIARPMVMSLNGQKGVVDFGDRVPVLTRSDTGSYNTLTVTYEDVGTKLEMTPIINEASGDITLNVSTEVSNITGWVSSGDTKAPQMATRKATTSAHVKSGQSFVIGGLMSAKDLDNLSGIPGLMDLPILGKLFSYHSHSKDYAEVYIMITPFIVTDDLDPQDLYRELTKHDAKVEKDKADKFLPAKDWAKNVPSAASSMK